MLGGATQAMPLCIVEERQQRRRPSPRPFPAKRDRHAGCVARSLHTHGYARRSRLPTGLGACSKVQMLFCGGPLKPEIQSRENPCPLRARLW